MPSQEELYTALRNADAAGDTEGAKKLADYIQSQGNQAAPVSDPAHPNYRAAAGLPAKDDATPAILGAARGVSRIGDTLLQGASVAADKIDNYVNPTGLADLIVGRKQNAFSKWQDKNHADLLATDKQYKDNAGYNLADTGAQIAATYPLGGAIGEAVSPFLPALGKAIATGGMDAGGAGLVTRLAGGGISGASQIAALGGSPKDIITGAGIGAALPAVVQGAGKLGQLLTPARNIDGEVKAAQNATRDASLKEAQDAGLSIPRSLYDPSFTSNRLESIGGKTATIQLATDNNQTIYDNMARKALGVSEDTPMDSTLLRTLKTQAAAPYRDAEKLTKEVVGQTSARSLGTGQIVTKDIVKDGKQLVDEINEARDASRGLWADSKSAIGTARNAARKAAQAMDDHLSTLENQLDTMAVNQGKPELVSQLNDARKQIAQIYSVDDALNKGTGSIDSLVFARKFQKGRLADSKGNPFDPNLMAIGRFAKTFKEVAPRGGSLSGADVSALEPLSAAVYASAGHAATGNVAGMVAGGIPLLRGPARKLALSELLQSTPQYGSGNSALSRLLTQLPDSGDNTLAQLLTKSAPILATGHRP